MHHPTDRITHTTAFVTPVVEHWQEREIALYNNNNNTIIIIIIIILGMTTTQRTRTLIMDNASNLVYGLELDMPMDLSFCQPLTLVTRLCIVLCIYLLICKVSFYIHVLLYVYRRISCIINLFHLSMFIICIYKCRFYYHYENWHIKYKWFCG